MVSGKDILETISRHYKIIPLGRQLLIQQPIGVLKMVKVNLVS